MREKYSSDIVSAWEDYLTDKRYSYTFNEEKGEFLFKSTSYTVDEELEYTVKIDMDSYCIRAKLPLQVDENKINDVSSFIHSTNQDTLYAYFALDYDSMSVFCVLWQE